MAIVYCCWTTGNDTTGDGSYGNPYKTITKADDGLSGGDEVRVSKSAAHTALTGTLDVWCDGAPVMAYSPPAAGGETLEIFVHDCTDTLESLH